jgi:hypothetical protein
MLDMIPLLTGSDDKPQYPHVRVNLLGRYMLTDRREFPCQIVDMSPDQAFVAAPVSGSKGEQVVAYVDHLGRLEGNIVRLLPNGFCMTVLATARKREKLAAQLTTIAQRRPPARSEDSRPETLGLDYCVTIVTMPDGSSPPCRILELSVASARLASSIVPPLGSIVTLGKLGARVRRHIDGGFEVEFAPAKNLDTLKAIVIHPPFPPPPGPRLPHRGV